MRRHILNIATILLSLACFVVIAFWIRSTFSEDRIIWERNDGSVYRVVIDWGQFNLLISTHPSASLLEDQPAGLYFDSRRHQRIMGRSDDHEWTGLFTDYLGFDLRHARDSAYLDFDVTIPFWFCCAGSGILAIFCRRRTLSRVRQGKCPICEYNLTANVTGICPECGSPIQSKAISPA